MLRRPWSNSNLRVLMWMEWWVHHVLIFTLKYFVFARFMFIDCATSWREYLRCAMLERHQTGPPCWSQQSKGEKSNCIVFSMALTTTNIVEGKWLNKVLHLNPKMGWSRHSGIQRSSQPIFWTNPWLSRRGKSRQTFHGRLFLQNIFCVFLDVGQNIWSQRESILSPLQGEKKIQGNKNNIYLK